MKCYSGVVFNGIKLDSRYIFLLLLFFPAMSSSRRSIILHEPEQLSFLVSPVSRIESTRVADIRRLDLSSSSYGKSSSHICKMSSTSHRDATGSFYVSINTSCMFGREIALCQSYCNAVSRYLVISYGNRQCNT